MINKGNFFTISRCRFSLLHHFNVPSDQTHTATSTKHSVKIYRPASGFQLLARQSSSPFFICIAIRFAVAPLRSDMEWLSAILQYILHRIILATFLVVLTTGLTHPCIATLAIESERASTSQRPAVIASNYLDRIFHIIVITSAICDIPKSVVSALVIRRDLTEHLSIVGRIT